MKAQKGMIAMRRAMVGFICLPLVLAAIGNAQPGPRPGAARTIEVSGRGDVSAKPAKMIVPKGSQITALRETAARQGRRRG
jgi:hypothetical protein